MYNTVRLSNRDLNHATPLRLLSTSLIPFLSCSTARFMHFNAHLITFFMKFVNILHIMTLPNISCLRSKNPFACGVCRTTFKFLPALYVLPYNLFFKILMIKYTTSLGLLMSTSMVSDRLRLQDLLAVERSSFSFCRLHRRLVVSMSKLHQWERDARSISNTDIQVTFFTSGRFKLLRYPWTTSVSQYFIYDSVIPLLMPFEIYYD